MKVLIVGQGGREHVLAWKLSRCARVSQVFVAPGNAGTAAEAVNIDLPVTEVEGLAEFAAREGVALTVIGPEASLAVGMADAFRQRRLRVFGPDKAAAELEGSKAFSKNFMRQNGIPTADFKVFDNPRDAPDLC